MLKKVFIDIILLGILTIGFFSCTNRDKNTIYFADYNLFNLEGIDTLKGPKGREYVKVKYLNNFPVLIKFYRPKTTITLSYVDSFKIDSQKTIYVFSTSNFYGGPVGRHRVYGFRYEEYKQFIYISNTDTILCEDQEVPKSQNSHYDMYIRESNARIVKITRGAIRFDGPNYELAEKESYLQCFGILLDYHLRDTMPPIIYDRIPGGDLID